MSDELKACPFCGKEAHFIAGNAECKYCGGTCLSINGSKNNAIEQWNTRPIEDGLRAELARRDEQMQMDESNHEYEIHRRDKIITRLKLAGNNMYFTCSDDPYQVVSRVHDAWLALMKELE